MLRFSPPLIAGRFLRLLRLSAICFSAAAVSRGTTVLTDFGQSGYETTTDSAGRRWNNVTQNAAGGTTVSLVDTTNAATGLTLTLTAPFNLGDYNTNGDTTSAGLPYDASATRDSLFGNAGSFGSASNVVPVLTLTGLDPARTYTLTFFASRSASDNRIAKYIVAGAAVASVFLDANGPAPHTVALAGVAPAADGSIRITIRNSTVAESGLPVRGAGDNATGFAYLGVLEIHYVTPAAPPPVSPVRPLVILPLGSSITAGQSAQSPYNGGGYRTPLYQALEADGRFAPAYVGSSTTLLANSPTAPNYLTTVGQLHHEGHPGYTTAQVLANLTANAGTGGNNGGFWLSPGNGRNPDFITLNIGGNDFVANHTDTTAIGRLDQLLTDLATLRPAATTIVSSIVYRPDIGAYLDTYYNPYIEALVYAHTLAGHHVRYLDLRTILGTGYLSSDNIHPTQAGYDLMAQAWYQSITRGAAYWVEKTDSNWNTLLPDGSSHWATDVSLLSLRTSLPDATTDVYFTGPAGVTHLGQDLSVRGLNFGVGATTPITLAAGHVLTLGAGGITVQNGSASHVLAASLWLGANQTWANASTLFTVAGAIGGTGNLDLAGTATIVLGGANTYSGATTVRSGILQIDGSTTASSRVEIHSGGTLTGTGQAGGTVVLQTGATLAPGNGPGRLTTGAQQWAGGAAYRWHLHDATAAAGVGCSTLLVNGTLDLSAVTAANPVKLALKTLSSADPTASGLAQNFAPDRPQIWLLATASGGITGFSPDRFTIQPAGFANTLAGGSLSVTADALHLYLNFTPAPPSISQWRSTHFGTTTDAGIASDLNDPDGDGVPNLLEYALRGDPSASASAPRPSVEVTEGVSGLVLALAFPTVADPALTYQVDAAYALDGTWAKLWSANGAATLGAEMVVRDTELLATHPGRFLRLLVSH